MIVVHERGDKSIQDWRNLATALPVDHCSAELGTIFAVDYCAELNRALIHRN